MYACVKYIYMSVCIYIYIKFESFCCIPKTKTLYINYTLTTTKYILKKWKVKISVPHLGSETKRKKKEMAENIIGVSSMHIL